ncbi:MULTISPECIES: hypothetical protein [unclassified Halomonas]|uniref:hypothetical protein n=1 Tax=unclassified Halomonas TaxID=2609666 RepID=UPI0021E41B11|nr:MULTISPECIES: hypothetical protein [unclassified Halomonas]UYF98894.1 hypothetical protein OCT39_11725 [Halomonas sp. GD1P12]WNL39989.1 hypothetical protein RN346_05345 [Halomonas sp. PAMB 3232]WNL43297.1 hypothetical protein RN347_05175 [Halomonas sp. PAMB 3264]
MTRNVDTADTRAMTPRERAYAEQVIELRRWRARLNILIGLLMLLTVAGVLWVVLGNAYVMKMSSSAPLMFFGIALFGVIVAWYIIKVEIGRKVVLGEEVHRITGYFHSVSRTGGPQTSGWREYFVGDVSLRTPFMVDLVPPKNEDREMEAEVVFIHTYPKKHKWIDKYQDPEAIALYIDGQVDIDKRGSR